MIWCVALEPQQAISGSLLNGNNPKHPISIDYRLQLRFNIIIIFTKQHMSEQLIAENVSLYTSTLCATKYRALTGPSTGQWSLYVRPDLTFSNSTFCPHSCIYVLCVDLRTSSDYFPIQN